MTFGLIFILSIFGLTTTATESWQCRNDVEIHCAEGKCDAKKSGEFTPMSVSFDNSGMMEVCAYTGCWKGTGKVSNNGDFMMLSGQNLKFSTSNINENIAITLDKKDNIALVKAGSFAQPLVCKKGTQNAELPKFEDYKVKVSNAKPKPIRFRGNRDARMFRTRLRQANKNGVNFAGHYIFASWGCGTSCLQGAIINTKTGVVYFPKELGGMTFSFLGEDDIPLQYQKDSKLFILNGTAGNAEENGKSYFVWQGTKFKKIKFVKNENSQFD